MEAGAKPAHDSDGGVKEVRAFGSRGPYSAAARRSLAVTQSRAPARSFNWWPTSAMALIAGTSCWPRSVSEYSTEGGEVGFTSRTTTPLASSARRRAVSTLAETLGMWTRSALKDLKSVVEGKRV